MTVVEVQLGQRWDEPVATPCLVQMDLWCKCYLKVKLPPGYSTGLLKLFSCLHF